VPQPQELGSYQEVTIEGNNKEITSDLWTNVFGFVVLETKLK
jgi:hypothetical protein